MGYQIFLQIKKDIIINNLIIFILVGGFGTRLKTVVSNIPKPMAPINNKPFLDYKIDHFRNYFPNNQIILLTHYLSNYIENYYKNYIDIVCIKEDEPLGTGGALKNAIQTLDLKNNQPIILTNGDTYIKPNYQDFVNYNGDIRIMCSYKENNDRYGTVDINNNIIEKFSTKLKSNNSYINTGCYFFKKLSFIKSINKKKFAIEDEFEKMIKKEELGAYVYDDIFIDIGIPKDYKLLQSEINEHEK